MMKTTVMMTDAERAKARARIMDDSRVYLADNALLHHKIALLRRKETNNKEFRELVAEIAMLMTYDATRGMALKRAEVLTGMNVTMQAQVLDNDEIMLVNILRAGAGMVDGMLKLLPTAKVAHVGVFRDPETKLPQWYYFKVPETAAKSEVFIADPMLATGGSAIETITRLKSVGCQRIRFICILAAPEGVVALRDAHPDIDIYVGELDERLDENAYILPGLGDAGDRLFGTK